MCERVNGDLIEGFSSLFGNFLQMLTLSGIFLLENSKVSKIPPEMSVCSDVGLKVSTPNTTTAVLLSPEQSRIVHHPYKLDLTTTPIKLDSSFFKQFFYICRSAAAKPSRSTQSDQPNCSVPITTFVQRA